MRPGQAGVGDEHVGEPAEHCQRYGEVACDGDRAHERIRRRRAVEELGRTTDAVGAEGRERDGLFEAGELAPQSLP